MIEWWGDTIQEYYAATEGGGTIVTAKEWMERPGTVGKAWPGSEIRIFDDDGNQLAARPDRHRLHAAGQADFEYKGDPAKTKANRIETASSRSATSASSTRTATCSCATARAT